MKKGEIILQPQTEASRRLRDRNKDVIRLQSRYLIRTALQSLRWHIGAFLKSGFTKAVGQGSFGLGHLTYVGVTIHANKDFVSQKPPNTPIITVSYLSDCNIHHYPIPILFSVGVICCFMICWLPYHLQRTGFVILTYKNHWGPFWRMVHKHFYHVSGAFYYLNSFFNPFLYTILSRRYRDRMNALWERLWICMTPNLESFAPLSNVQSIELNLMPNINLSSILRRKSTPDITVLYRNGEAHVSFGQISRISKESNTRIIKSTEVWMSYCCDVFKSSIYRGSHTF